MLHLDDEDASEPEEVAIDSHGRVRGVSACVTTRDAHFLDVRTKVATNALPPAVAADLVGDCEAAFVLVFPLSHRPGCCPVANRRLLVSPRHFSHENHREAFRAVRNTPPRAPETTSLLHTMKTICESCCDSPATLVACGREATVLCGTCDTPRYAPAA